MTRLAIDIVLLPPDHIMNLAIDWNQHLANKLPQHIILSKTQYVPHISLLMGCLATERMADAEAALREIAIHYSSQDLEISRSQVAGDEIAPVVVLDIARSSGLLSLHQKVLDLFAPLLTQDTTPSDIDDSPPIAPSSIQWINNFMTNQSGEKFWPHITVGHGKPEKLQERNNFKATRIAIFHLGNHCTCKRLLLSASLKN